MYTPHRKLADLHTHLYGCIEAADFLEYLLPRDVDWSDYQSHFRRVYGAPAPIEEILDRCRRRVAGSDADFSRLFVFGDDDAGNFDRFQAKYDMLNNGGSLSGFATGEVALPALIDEVGGFIHKIIARQYRHNVGYIEQRMNLGAKFTRDEARELVDAMLTTYADYEGSDIQPRLAISLARANPWPDWEVVRDAALGPLSHLLTGIDFCYLEEGHPPKNQARLFAEVRDFNRQHPERALAILYHVGESFTDKSLESAIRWVHEAAELGAHRLGHAISLGVDPNQYGQHVRSESVAERVDQLHYDLRHREGLAAFGVHIDVAAATAELEGISALPAEHVLAVDYDNRKLQEVRQRQNYAMACVRSLGAVIEVCPTSNRRIGGITRPEHHPVRQFLANDAPFVIASDDPGIFGTTLADELAWVAE
jgi:adenosine deaminase